MTLKRPHGFLGSTNETFELARLSPLMLDWLGPDYITKEEISLRGYDVPCYPSLLPPGRLFKATFSSISGATRFLRIGFLRLISCSAASPPVS